LPGNVPMVASTFDNMTSSRVGIAMRLDVLPESLLVYVPYLPDVLTDIGVVDNDKIIPYDDMQNRLRREVLGLNASFSSNGMTGRVELVLRGSGSNLDELHNAIGWMNKALYSPYLSEDNLPRMKDVIDQKLVSLRNRMKGSEENWVGDPAGAYRYQTNPLYLSAQSFLTQIHHAQRLKWLLTDPGTKEDQQALSEFLDDLKAFGKDRPREKFTELFAVADNPEATPSEEIKPVLTIFTSEYVSDDAKGTARQILSTLKSTLPDIPDANLTGDWAYLCDEIKADLMVKPDQTIAGLKQTLDLIRHADNARMFMISSGADRDATLDEIKQLAGKLGTTSSKHVEYADTYRIVKRSEEDKPVYAGLMNEGTRNGVLIFSAVHAGRYDTSRTAVLDALAGKLYGGSGAHGLFMKTWGAGLAYSNGFGYSDATGRVSYYAERCPDVAQTMGFVVGVLKNAEDDPYLKEYAIAQAFLASRAASKYESRGEAMAADLADGITPEVVRRYRQAILDVRDMDNLYETIKERMPGVYGEVLIGYGPSLADSKDATLFMIGPESQFESLQRYIETTEGKEDIWRLYPRDFWLTRANGKS
ncbi:MAG: hypothetical protein PVH24_02690, partial [Candidatus Zixiibacteriota bacterium]